MTGWSTEWPKEEGWYWVWDPGYPMMVEPGRVLKVSNGFIYARGGEGIHEKSYPGVQWHPMEKPPEPPRRKET